ncbi:hypothetical protein [Bacillus benzoevorans]|uniref:Uncharacterized protein n=1 Tax=Bacillus benzoevorans TaxID=1456 RepID=A0A7X0LUP5_9BACI|nr:hypothetical protein [Bacillus benzoevorans]MBB6443459.1 hypothetical protein [Bacillus benzoevorans]
MIGVEGTKTPAGTARQTRPRRHEVARRLGGRPRKAKCLERKSTTKFNRAYTKKGTRLPLELLTPIPVRQPAAFIIFTQKFQ